MTLAEQAMYAPADSACDAVQAAGGDNSDEMMKSVLRSLEDVKGREGFRGKDADKAIRDVKEVAGVSIGHHDLRADAREELT
eukprot:762586-Hanusia_phi.AAC.1